MVTTTTEAYAEHDKLGPLGGKSPALTSDAELRGVLIHEFEATAAAARTAAGMVERSATTAVHETRKALRRARAVLSMISEALPKSERRAVKSALQEARRALSSVRDHAVAPATLGALELSDDGRQAAKQVLDNAAQAMPAVAEIKQLLVDSAGRVAAQVEALSAALPPEIAWSTIADGVESVYGAARRARRKAKGSTKQFHHWRRRSKELALQLELVALHAGPRAEKIHAELESVTDSLGSAVDLIMLRDFIHTYAQGVAPAALEQLEHAIDAHLGDLMKKARKGGRDAFERPAHGFAKRLGRAVRKDLAPPEPASESAS